MGQDAPRQHPRAPRDTPLGTVPTPIYSSTEFRPLRASAPGGPVCVGYAAFAQPSICVSSYPRVRRAAATLRFCPCPCALWNNMNPSRHPSHRTCLLPLTVSHGTYKAPALPLTPRWAAHAPRSGTCWTTTSTRCTRTSTRSVAHCRIFKDAAEARTPR